ncbi:hypothetical protein CKAH01_06195 [Colletotrichum kahawae]|uniref:Secreted protein n=1 Tax=Colletotrichum kahawae TaxID=34407 RepID=A0AAE0D3B2_COLKA|nr:hypothetical protein CKAH01_06195 [Colletotrichum kahawae]
MRPSGSLYLIAAVILVVVHLQGRRTVTASEHRNSGREGSGVGGPNRIRGSAPGPWSLGRGKKNGQRTGFTVFECGTWEDQVTSAVAGGSTWSGGSQAAPNEFPQSGCVADSGIDQCPVDNCLRLESMEQQSRLASM